MGRPKLYHTAEQRKEAKQLKNARHYLKNKEKILAKRKAPKAQLSTALLPRSSSNAQAPPDRTMERSTVRYWFDRTDCKSIALRLHYAGTPREFLEKQAQKYLHDTNKNALSKHIKYLTKFQSSFRRYEGEILQLEGVGPGLEKAERMSREVTEVIVWLEELLCQSMVGLLSFQAVYLAKRFMYQNESSNN